jgi:hypothetical protein
LLTPAEQVSVIDDWCKRARLYKMTDNPDLRAKHVKRLGDLEALQDYDTAVRGPAGARMVLGLTRADEFRAVAAAEVSKSAGLVVTSICIYPAEVNKSDSTVSQQMQHALQLLADAIEVPLQMRVLDYMIQQ